MNQNDLEFLESFRNIVDEYLFLGYAPSAGTPGHDEGVDIMETKLKEPAFAEIRKKYSQMKARAKTIVNEYNISASMTMRFPAAAGGGYANSHIFDLVTNNTMWQRIEKQQIFDIIDEAIGKIKLGGARADGYKNKKISIFISHGPESAALKKLEDFIRDFGLNPIIAEKEPTKGRDIDPDAIEKMEQCEVVIIIATGDDILKDNTRQPRGNVISEMRLAEQKKKKIIYLLEKNTKFPSLHASKAWEGFEQDNMEKAFAKIVRELVAFKII